MLFDEINSERQLEQLKRRILRDDKLYAHLERLREHAGYSRDGTMVWKKFAPYHKTGKRKMPSNAEMLLLYRDMVRVGTQRSSPTVESLLRKFKVRSNSGVAVVSLLTKPYPCPGRCIYCPTEKRMPKSYLSREPAAARALANKFDPYRQVTSRLRALQANGHPIDKIEIIVIGGTWSYYHPAYQREFIQEVFRACNNFLLPPERQVRKGEQSLEQLHRENETAPVRIIGLSVETRPDHITLDELERMRALGVTKVELGVQHLDDRVLAYNQRDMTADMIARTTELLRNAGFKIVYHMMPNLPGSNPQMDIAQFQQLFSGRDYHPDMLKIYPCMVLKRSKLYKIWAQGGFTAYTDEELVRVLREAKRSVPPYVRIIRVIRDIPADYIIAGSKRSNLRQLLYADQRAGGWRCVCIRCREVRDREVSLEDYHLVRHEYVTRHGREIFLSFEHKRLRLCASFLRLRLPDGYHARHFTGELSVLRGAALIRELHTYGQLKRVREPGDQSQHRGFGRRLMHEAETIARKAGYTKLAVIAGVGVREYYKRKLGYELNGTYMVKNI